MCGMIGFKDVKTYHLQQSVPKQQINFELPFYMFVVVITAFLFVWRHFYEIVLVSLEDDDINEEEDLKLKSNSLVELDGKNQPSPNAASKGLYINEPLLDSGKKNGAEASKHEQQQAKIEIIDKKLSKYNNIIGLLILTAILSNTMMNLLHYIDTEESNETTRYTIGNAIYMTLWTSLAVTQLAIVVFAFYVYISLFRLLHIPRSERIADEDSEDYGT